MPLGLNRTDLNTTGITYKDGSPVDWPTPDPAHFGNPVDWLTPDPAHFGNPIPSDGNNQNIVDWMTPNPAHFGNIFGGSISGDQLELESGLGGFELEDGSGVILLET
jgi:hypothetical protein